MDEIAALRKAMVCALDAVEGDAGLAEHLNEVAVGFHDSAFRVYAQARFEGEEGALRKKSRERAPEDARRDVRGQGGPDNY